jgi:hypothetical protein
MRPSRSRPYPVLVDAHAVRRARGLAVEEHPERNRLSLCGYRHASFLRQSLLPPNSWRKNRKTFRTSRKMLAAIGTASSWPERRSRLKSRIV